MSQETFSSLSIDGERGRQGSSLAKTFLWKSSEVRSVPSGAIDLNCDLDKSPRVSASFPACGKSATGLTRSD